ncbi:helix-turn-helix transcriptional regulator [Lentzea tibetensis]|uniref:Helix-turn-helix transcriptional regulator n=2 Tax=Lentzea tibetensis TaxID=2591470 RepID=A0A563EKE3_9PSEU|nr:helix-turn-helix transcriptional regulator [Lentzea tibetensis]
MSIDTPLEKRSGVVHATESISTLIPQARRERGLTQEELARRLSEISRNDSITREDISRWERGKRIPGPYWRGWISKALEMPCADVERAAHVARTTRREHRRVR